MMKKLFILIFISFIWLGFSGLISPKENLPLKKINKAITKIWKVSDFEVIDYEVYDEQNCDKNGCWLKVVNEGSDLGMIYVGRVNSCRSGGCSIDQNDDEALAFEYFDYFALVDLSGEVLWLKVFNYQATQGHEVMSRGWLNQFNGMDSDTKLILGKDIESITGATVSANALTNDIQRILLCMAGG